MSRPQVRIQAAASLRIDEIYRYTRSKFGATQAEKYIRDLFNRFEQISDKTVISRPIPADFGVQGFYYRYERHFVYWKYLANGDIGIATVLHERMHQIEHFKYDFKS